MMYLVLLEELLEAVASRMDFHFLQISDTRNRCPIQHLSSLYWIVERLFWEMVEQDGAVISVRKLVGVLDCLRNGIQLLIQDSSISIFQILRCMNWGLWLVSVSDKLTAAGSIFGPAVLNINKLYYLCGRFRQ